MGHCLTCIGELGATEMAKWGGDKLFREGLWQDSPVAMGVGINTQPGGDDIGGCSTAPDANFVSGDSRWWVRTAQTAASCGSVCQGLCSDTREIPIQEPPDWGPLLTKA